MLHCFDFDCCRLCSYAFFIFRFHFYYSGPMAHQSFISLLLAHVHTLCVPLTLFFFFFFWLRSFVSFAAHTFPNVQIYIHGPVASICFSWKGMQCVCVCALECVFKFRNIEWLEPSAQKWVQSNKIQWWNNARIHTATTTTTMNARVARPLCMCPILE